MLVAISALHWAADLVRMGRRWLHLRAFRASLQKFGVVEASGLQISEQLADGREEPRLEKMRQALSLIAEKDPAALSLILQEVKYILIGQYKTGPRFVNWTHAILVPVAFLDQSSPGWIAGNIIHQATAAEFMRENGRLDAAASDAIARNSLVSQIAFLERLDDSTTVVESLKARGRSRWPAQADLFA